MDRPIIFTAAPQLIAAQSTRHGGVSPAPYASLNLGKSTGDDPAHLAENRRRFAEALGFPIDQLAWSKQVHGDRIRYAACPGGAEGFDALITDQPGVVLAVSIADCTPILVLDRKNRAVAAVHAGWRGTVAGIVEKTLQEMSARFGTLGADCLAYVGTCISANAFEVGDEVAAEFADPFKRYDATRGRFFVDLKKANAAQVLDFGIPPAQLEISPRCTVEHNTDYFSHRREQGRTGRMLAVIGLKP